MKIRQRKGPLGEPVRIVRGRRYNDWHDLAWIFFLIGAGIGMLP